ncbi:Protein involved in sex pheromone biosynthesis [Pelagirhabdus alkalitolerans]|uniref:Protein involved in sex pheromone biosynthesis n=1 Tax=Pelagirhabdus alkalitolerans TaxID=1612202 RepID=A0A1G6IS13_9BACI|nr:CamS family sex pheromone protein [Pelagirhabdus alkalitolerans]SDC09297.1 Protein involved in sex pheromone biosynthesis [Pelagirhabdus alkalitolerans]
MKTLVKGCLLGILVLVVGCAPDFSESQEEVVDETQPEDADQQSAIIPSHRVSDEEYQVLLPYQLSESRGVTTNQIANRLDIRALENDLRRHSTDVFDPENHFFQEGQHIGSSELFSWLERESDDSDLGLNPSVDYDEDSPTDEAIEEERDNPRYLSHILEQNYLTRTDDDTVHLSGISLGIAMKSNYRFQTEVGGPYYYEDISEEEMLSEANEIVDEVMSRIRDKDGLADVPVMIAVYREAARDGLVPGNMVAKTTVEAGSQSVDDWEAIDEQYVLFPSSTARDVDPDLSATIEDFKNDVADYFPNYVGTIGEGFYEEDQLQSLTLEIPIEFQGQAEVVGFTQYVYGLIMDSFQTHYALEVNIKSNDRQEALIFREAGDEEATIHIFDR